MKFGHDSFLPSGSRDIQPTLPGSRNSNMRHKRADTDITSVAISTSKLQTCPAAWAGWLRLAEL
jgi:hypothetical protein